MKCLIVFVVGGLIFGAVSIAVGFAFTGHDGLLESSVAFALSFIPAVATLAWVTFSYRTTPDMQMIAGLGGSGIRMGITLGGGYFLTHAQPESFGFPFWCWVLWFYLVLLAFEITLLVRQQPTQDLPPKS